MISWLRKHAIFDLNSTHLNERALIPFRFSGEAVGTCSVRTHGPIFILIMYVHIINVHNILFLTNILFKFYVKKTVRKI